MTVVHSDGISKKEIERRFEPLSFKDLPKEVLILLHPIYDSVILKMI